MRIMRVLVTMVLGVLVVAGVIFFVQHYQPQKQSGGAGRANRQNAVPVLAASVKTDDVPVYLDGVGTTKALNTVTVRPQVDGKLISVNFREGQDVEKGDVLAKIDPTTYQAQLDQAVAKKAQDEAMLDNAKRDLERYSRLAASNAGTKQQADTQRATVAQLEAQVRLDQAAIDNARAVLAYTTITAPLSGRTGIRLVDEGNIVHASDSTGIVVITQVKPIAVFFNLPQQRLADINAAMAKGVPRVDVVGQNNKTVVETGKLTVMDNQVDQTTGTVRLKGEFPNDELRLWPGQFVNVRLLIDTLRGVTTVPTAAVQRGPNGTFVFVIKPDDTVAVQPVAVAQQDDVQSVISGVSVGQQVVTTGFSQLAEGKAVRVSNGSPSAPEASRPPRGEAAGARRRDRGGPDAQRRNRQQGSEAAPTERPTVQSTGSRASASQ
jgi:multidrug efflux system membrane fusion protein